MPTPTVLPASNFDPEQCVKQLRQAMDGFSKDEDAVISVMAGHTNKQRQEIKSMYKTAYGEDLEEELASSFRGDFEDTLLALTQVSGLYDAKNLRKAMKGPGTDDAIIIEIMCARENDELAAIKETYKTEFDRDLEEDLQSETSGDFKRMLVSLCNGSRSTDNSVDDDKAQEDASELFQAGKGKLGTDESTFNMILCLRNYPQLRATFHYYEDLTGNDICEDIKSEMRGNIEKGYLTIVKYAKNAAAFYAELLNDAVRGAGTDEEALIRAIISRCEKDMQDIKESYKGLYGKTLAGDIADDVSGKFKKILLALIGGD